MKNIILSLFTLIILSSLVLLHSCAPTEDDPVTCKNSSPQYYTLTADQKAIIPYSGYDTISMVSNTGDTIHCIGNGKQYFNTNVFERHPHPDCTGYGTEKFYEAYKIEFVDSSKNKKIELIHYKKVFFPNGFIVSEQFSTVSIVFENKAFYIGDDQISDPTTTTYFGDVLINQKVYKKASKVSKDYTDTLYHLYINKIEGVLKFNLNNQVKWEKL